jgi:hypothetical protein
MCHFHAFTLLTVSCCYDDYCYDYDHYYANTITMYYNYYVITTLQDADNNYYISACMCLQDS